MRSMTDKNLELLSTVPEAQKRLLRERREKECFSVVDRAAWYDGLTDEKKADVQAWRKAWLDAPKTMVVPEKPSWIK